MAKTLSKTGIATDGTITAAHVTQSIDALTGTEAYNVTISGSLNINLSPITNLTASGDVDFNGDLDVDGTTNLDVVDIDGAVDMASNLTIAGTISNVSTTHITASGNISSSGTLIGGGLDITGTTTFNDGNITNVGSIDVDTIRGDAATSVSILLGTAGITFLAESGDSYSFNESGEIDADFKYFDNTETQLVHFDAALARVGIADTSPSAKLDVNGNLQVQSNITASGNIKAGRYAETLQDVTAAGSNQGDATDLAGSSANGLFIVSGADNAKGVKLPAVANIPVGTRFTIINTVSNRTLEVYPATNDNIGPTLPDNGAATVPTGGSLIVIKYNSNGYMGYFGTAPS